MAAKMKKTQNRNCENSSAKRSSEQRGVGKGVICTKNANAKRRKSTQQLFMNENDYRHRLQEVLHSPEHIFSKIFRKDGPPLGDEFDSIPEHAFLHCNEDAKNSHRLCRENRKAHKRRKVLTTAISEGHACGEVNTFFPRKKRVKGKDLIITKKGISTNKHGIGKGLMNVRSVLSKRHGIGKGLMTVWRATNPDSTDFPTYVTLCERDREKKKLQQRQSILKRLKNKSQDMRKHALKSRKLQMKAQKASRRKQPHRGKCELALDGKRKEDNDQFALLMDDEELELKELRTGPNPLTCCTHFTGNGLHGCSLCKGLLAKFPPDTVTMKPPLCMQPWDSSPELARKLFKIFHFLCTYASITGISSFTLDEFACAFHDKESLLLGRVHVALLGLLFSDVEMLLGSGIHCHSSKNFHFLDLVHTVEHNNSVLKVWLGSLNALTWIEILRQVLAASGFGSQCSTVHKGALSKEDTLMANYGIAPGTLKGELFSILLVQGNKGMKIPELAKLQSIVELNPIATTNELEDLISSTLSSDITLFEKISSSGYRLRINPNASQNGFYRLDAKGDDDSEVSSEYCSGDDSDIDCLTSSPFKPRRMNHHINKTLTLCTEIDESHKGEPWFVGLMEGEYSNLCLEEKLNVLSALIDLLSSASGLRVEDPVTTVANFGPVVKNYGSGAKIKRSTAKPGSILMQVGGYSSWRSEKTMNIASALHPVDSLAVISTNFKKDNRTEEDGGDDLHPMQSIFLGSDRRYNRYWIFLGPCDDLDPGHRRIYFESSEDGHWEVIDTEEALGTLLSALDRRGAREARLLASLEKRQTVLSRAMLAVLNSESARQPVLSNQCEMSVSREDSSSSAVSDVDNASLAEVQNGHISAIYSAAHLGRKGEPHRDKWSLAQAFDAWIWKSFYSNFSAVKHGKRSYLESLARCEGCHDLYWRDEKHCIICHTTFELDFDLEERYVIHAATCGVSLDTNKFPIHKKLSSQLQSLKAAIYAIELVMPRDALAGSWSESVHNLWAKRLRRASTLTEVLQVLADFVNAINEEWVYQFIHDGENSVREELLEAFPTMPQTVSAVALWLVKLDKLIALYTESAASHNTVELNAKSKGCSMSTSTVH